MVSVRPVLIAALTLLTALALAALPVGLGGCKGRSDARTKVAVSVFPVFDLTRRIAGPDADVVLVVPAGRDPRTFEPASRDAEAVAGAKLGVMVGLGLDPWMEQLARDASAKARVLKVGDRVPTLAPDPGGAVDPHFWLDPERARIATKAIGEELARGDSAHASAYRKRAAELDAALELLDKEIEQKTSAWPRKRFVVASPGLAYFADRYKLDIVVAPPAAGGDTDAGLARDPMGSKVSSASPTAPDSHESLGRVFGGATLGDTYEMIVRGTLNALAAAPQP